jgi:hypothetical protein
MKRFFTKKSVALIFTTILLVGSFSFNIALAITQQDIQKDAALIESLKNNPNLRTKADYDATLAQLQQNLNSDTMLFQSQQAGTQTPSGNFNVPAVSTGQTASVPPTQATADQVTAAIHPKSPTENMSMMETIGYYVKEGVSAAIAPITTQISGAVQLTLIPIAAFGLGIAGMILDFSVKYTIYGDDFRTMSNTISSIWTLLRDIANICFIFVLLYAAIQQIINGSASKKILTSVIISAVLINFSLFVTRVVIDASNIVATSLYNQITLVADSTKHINNVRTPKQF